MLFSTWAIFIIYIIQGCIAAYVEVTPREVVALPKQNVTFLCKVGVALQYCRIEIPGMHTFNLNPNFPPSNGVVYFGAGLPAGQCGATIDSVKEENNGPVKCTMGTVNDAREFSATMTLTVAKSPKAPELDLSRGTDSVKVYRVNDLLQASCIVRDGRPAANISWFLDDEPIYENLGMVTIVDNVKEDLYSIVQNFTRKLRASDNGKKLRCVAIHPALSSQNNEVSRQLDIKYAPLPYDLNPIEMYEFELDKPGIITVDIHANPRPVVEWVIGDEHIREGNPDSTARFEAQAIRDEGRGHYIATLRVAALKKEDIETQFRLTAYNDQGSTEYYIVIHTTPQPEGLELGIGYIVGIVVALLILLLAIFLLVFARATGRWCFSGGAHVIDYTQQHGGETGVRTGANLGTDGVDNPHHQSSQEYINGRNQRHVGETSSDTESTAAEVKQQRQSKLKAPKLQFSNVFKKNKDKVSHEDETAKTMELDETKTPVEQGEKQQSDKPEGIVYAELDLVAQNLRPLVKNDDDKTEYAEIIYTQKSDSETEESKPMTKETKPTS